MTFGEQMRKLRLDKGITLEELAGHLNTTKATISRYENNHRVVNIEFAKSVAEFFNVSIDYLVEHNIPSNNTNIKYIEMANILQENHITEKDLEAIIQIFKYFNNKS